MEGLPIRSARRGDIPSLMLLWNAMMNEAARVEPRVALHAHAQEHMTTQFSAWVQDPDRLVVVAEEGGRLIVGYAAARITAGTGWHHPTQVGEITDCFVVPPRRRQGIARRMVGRMLDVMFERGLETVRLQVLAASAEARTFWESMGWEALEEILEWHEP